MAKKKITNVDTKENREKVEKTKANNPEKEIDISNFSVSEEAKAQAKKSRIIALIMWVVAIGCEVGAVLIVFKQKPINLILLIVLILIIMGLSIGASIIWKKANRLDPASKKEKVKFFVQNQLGFIMAILAFLPLILIVLTSKDMDKKDKGIISVVAVVALVVAGYFGIDFDPASLEEYAEQSQEVVDLTGQDFVYWTKSGTKYHLYSECQHINRDVTTEIFEGTVAQARALKNIEELCETCRKRWVDEHAEEATAYRGDELFTSKKYTLVPAL
ncbi:MAG: hypothetical protein ACK5G7_01245 [Erysipelotrichaceae bacterium]